MERLYISSSVGMLEREGGGGGSMCVYTCGCWGGGGGHACVCTGMCILCVDSCVGACVSVHACVCVCVRVCVLSLIHI